MALIKAKHAVYGEVLVPKSYLRLWPDAYKPADEPTREVDTTDSTPEGVVEGARTRTTNKKEQS